MTHEPHGVSGARGWRLPVLVLLSLALLAASVVLVIRAWDARDVAAAGSYGTTDVRDEVIATTEQFVLRMGTYGPKDLDKSKKLTGYRDRVSEMLTTKFRTSFEQSLEIVEQQVAQGAARSAKVQGIGLASVTADKATALVAWQANDTVRSEPYGDPVQFRWEVTIVKVKGDWRVDNFQPVTGETP
ncbi:hypothetical protein [Nocardioides cavernaquae]|uniref:Mce-associated membrane protein n=1 Tax=Nocardioides cavernaquae TaxID=2321396 RepID=A0A3A5H6U1_9ACTN|nr:hypothetical protein [Nocardioides cavernaquae]RJS46353.1 hypothetical protein D4739_09090 [Nocardioides cavernaquae]